MRRAGCSAGPILCWSRWMPPAGRMRWWLPLAAAWRFSLFVCLKSGCVLMPILERERVCRCISSGRNRFSISICSGSSAEDWRRGGGDVWPDSMGAAASMLAIVLHFRHNRICRNKAPSFHESSSFDDPAGFRLRLHRWGIAVFLPERKFARSRATICYAG